MGYWFIFTVSALNKKFGFSEERKWSPILEVPDCHTDSQYKYHRSCKEESVENLNANGVKRVDVCYLHSETNIFSENFELR